eukprot:4779428-Amphidinium_carterae.1
MSCVLEVEDLAVGDEITDLCIELHAYCDSDWTGCPISKKSTTGVICQFWNSSIVHYSRTQATVAQSSAEAELYALT